MILTSLENERVKNYIKLKETKYRKKTKTFIVEGLHLVLEAYKNGKIIELILEENESIDLDVPKVYVTRPIIERISTLDNPSNVMALCRMELDDNHLGNKVLLLDGIQDPGNLGTIIRSSVAFNVDTIVLSPECVDLYNPKVIRSTQGMLFGINIMENPLEETIKILHERNIIIYGTKVTDGEDVSLLEKKAKQSFGLVMGNEGNGVRKNILDMCDKFLYIAMNEQTESLNVAVATSILLYELNKKVK